MRKFSLLLFAQLLFFNCIYSQTKNISGRIVDEASLPVKGASVKIKGTDKGVIANENGAFQLTGIAESAILTVTAIGFQQTDIAVAGKTDFTITMVKAPQALTEVVVTALGIRRSRNELSYASQQLSGEEVSKTRTSNFATGLSGKIAGLDIKQNNTLGGSTNIVIRGYKSLTGNNQVLFVIDGVPVDNSNTNTTNQRTGRNGYDYGNAAADINPDDIESYNVLKGAAATALYGSRAANGAIIITTKKGRKGLGITINTGLSFGSIDKTTFAKYQKSYGAGYGSLNGYGSPDGNFFYFDVNGDGVDDLVTPTTEDASWGAKFDPSLSVYQWNAFDVTSPFYGKATPWQAAANDPVSFFVHPFATNNSVVIDGGSDKGTFKLGYTRSDEKGILPNSRINKDMINFGSTYDITDKLTVSGNINFTNIRGLGRYGTGYDSKNLATNFREWWQTNVDINEQKEAYFRTNKNVTWNWADPTSPDGLVPIYWDNPYWTRYQNFETDTRSRYFGNVSATYKLAKWLDILGRISLDSYTELQEERIAIGSVDVSQYSRFDRTFREFNYDLLANINAPISNDISFKAAAGINIRRNYISSVAASTNGGLSVPDIYSLSNTKNAIVAPFEDVANLGVDGIFASTSFGYKNYLFLDLTGRRDKSSSLPEENNAFFYPSASLGLVFSKLIPDATWLSYGKVRVNYAEVGNSAPARSLIDYYTINSSFNGASLTSASVVKNNPDLKPERTRSYEAGLEMAFLKNRLGFDVTYYQGRSLNQIVPAPVSRATGYSAKYINAGEIKNEGVEVSLNGTPVKTAALSWTINVNWSMNRNKVIDLGGEIDNLQLGSFQGGVTLNAALNEPYGTIRGSNFVYKDGQKVVKANGYYQVSATSNEVIGNVNPDWIGGVNNTIRYKDLALGFLIDVRHGGDVFSLDNYYGLATGLYPETAGNNDLGNPVRNSIATGGGVIFPGVTADGKANTKRVDISSLFGAYGYYRNPAAAFVYDASFVKLREVTLTYSLPHRLTDRWGPVKGIDLSFVGRNLWIIDKNLPYADPEEGISSGNLQGYQVGAYPSVRNFGFNLKVRF